MKIVGNLYRPLRFEIPNLIDPLFKMTVDTTQAGSASDTFVLPLQSTVNNFVVNWGDGSSETVTTVTSVSHTYASSGTYQITFSGSFSGIKFNNTGDKLKLSSIDNWGTNQWTSIGSAFWGCSNMVGTYSDSPDTSSVLLMDYAFRGCSIFNSPLALDTSSATSMRAMFWACTNFNQPLNFNTQNVIDLSYMMYVCVSFNQPINFNTSNATDTQWMFKGCSILNSSFNLSDTSNVTTMSQMFSGCSLFNQVINFDMASVIVSTSMFYNCINFNQVITFNAPVLSIANSMFERCYALDQPISLTTSSSLTNTSRMFTVCLVLNSSITISDTSSVTTMSAMFGSSPLFNQPLSFNTSSVVSMVSMFQGCTAFDQDISAFQINALTMATAMLTTSAFSITNYDLLLPAWDSYATNNVIFSAGTAHYSAGAPTTAHDAMVVRGWTITDGGTP